MGALQVLCLILSMYIYGTFGQLSSPKDKTSNRNGLLPSTVSGKASNVLRDILNQESLVRFSMVQKIQNLVMDAIDNKNNRQVIKTKLSEVTKELQDLETKSQIMEEENGELQEKLKLMYGRMNDNRNFTMEEIQYLNQTEVSFLKSKTSALQDENHDLALKNAVIEKQLDLLNKTIKQVESNIRKDIETLKTKDQSTLEKIKTLNELQTISAKNYLQKIKELDDDIGNTSLLLRNNDHALTKEAEVLKDQMNEINATLQKSGVDVLARRVKRTEDMFETFSVSVNETLDSVREELNESRWISFINLVRVLSKDAYPYDRSCWDILRKFPSLKGRDGVYRISIASEVKSVYCDMSTDGGGWTAIQRRQDGSTDFYRTWRDYKQGFGDPSKNYWIGNDAIYELTKNKDQELRVVLQSFDGDEAYAQYSTFYVGDEGSKYRLTVSGYSGTAGDSLNYHNGMRFSSKDEDNDNNSGNCATSYYGAWWYNNCHYSNLNGEYAQSALSNNRYPVWNDWKYLEALQKTVIMIRHQS